MRVLDIDPAHPGGLLIEVEVPEPVPSEDEVLIEVKAIGVNRADTSQRRGSYSAPLGAAKWPGLECAGVVVGLGGAARRWRVGDRVAALVAGGAYAEFVTVHESQVLRMPDRWSMVQAAAVPEAAATALSNLFDAGRLRRGETVLVHGGSGGVGSMAIQLARLAGARTVATVGSRRKAQFCRDLGVDEVLLHTDDNVTDRVMRITNGRGVDVILDVLGGGTVRENVERLALDGRLVVIGLQAGDEATVDLRRLLARRAVLTGSMLRTRPTNEKAALLQRVAAEVVPAIEDGAVTVPIDTVFSFSDAMKAHRRIESSEHCGKIVLEV